MRSERAMDRRLLLSGLLGATGLLCMDSSLFGMCPKTRVLSGAGLGKLGPLQKANALGVSLPEGYTARVVAESGKAVRLADGRMSSYIWHGAPDGGACFSSADGGWIYVSNAELDNRAGGVGALRFDADGQILDAYPILTRTNRNCAGGATPWGTWLSCEEIDNGAVFECDPEGAREAQLRKGLGYFKHEAAAVDPVLGHVYLTEDEGDGCFYRYTPSTISNTGVMDLDQGSLEVAVLDGNGNVSWAEVPNPNPRGSDKATRKQVKAAKRFDGGEGISYDRGIVYFTTKGDNRIWAYDTKQQSLKIIYDLATSSNPILSGVDNLTISSSGHILVAEDGGDMQIVVLTADGKLAPLVQLANQSHSEVTGPAISPNQKRLYFSSQRGPKLFGSGLTYELTGTF